MLEFEAFNCRPSTDPMFGLFCALTGVSALSPLGLEVVLKDLAYLYIRQDALKHKNLCCQC